MIFNIKSSLIGLTLLLMAACSYRTRMQSQLNQAIYQNDIKKAHQLLTKDEDKWLKGKSALLYYWDRATIAWTLGYSQESQQYFLKSDYFMEDVYKNYANIALSFLVNNKVKEYVGEDHERLLFHYYQIQNFIALGQNENALVQVRRLNLELDRLDQRYQDRTDKKIRRYQRDAFSYLIMGLAYESLGEKNNAWIAYKNAEKIYEEDYEPFIGISTPNQLKLDLLRLADELGFLADKAFYEKKFNQKYNPQTMQKGNAVVFWHSGLTPIKESWNLTFVIRKHPQTGWVNFFNAETGISVPVFVGEDKTKQGSSFSEVSFVRLAIPRYVTRPAVYQKAAVIMGKDTIGLEPAIDIEAIAKKIQKDRFPEELGKALLRLALKKATEIEVRKNNPDAGAALSLVNAITEQADLRSWETLPAQIHYVKLNIASDSQQVKLIQFGTSAKRESKLLLQYHFGQNLAMAGFHSFEVQRSAFTR